MTAIGHALLVVLASFNGYLLNADRGNAFGLVLLVLLPAGGAYFLGWWALLTFVVGVILGGRIYWSAVAAGRVDRGDQAPTSAWDALQNSPIFQQQKALFDAMSAMCEDGVDADELPNGRGEFGLAPTNPIPCRTTFGSTVYLGSLRAPDGQKVSYQRIGSVTTDVSLHPIDVYEITDATGRALSTVYISPYQKRNSSKAPLGLQLAGQLHPGSPTVKKQPLAPSSTDSEQDTWIGGVVIDMDNHVLLRKQNDRFYFDKWTLPLRPVSQSENAEDVAVAMVRSQTGFQTKVVGQLPAEYSDDKSRFRYFLMSPESNAGELDRGETTEVRWVNWSEAEYLLKRNMHQSCRERDLHVVKDALSMLSSITLEAAPHVLTSSIPSQIPNEELVLSCVPSGTSNIDLIIRFALTFDAYRALSFEQCAAISERVRSAEDLSTPSLTDLRVALFFAWRACRHVDMGVPDRGTCDSMRRLLGAIRKKVAA